MSKKNNTIEINGQSYDATTGALLSGSPRKQTTARPAATATSKHPARPSAQPAVQRGLKHKPDLHAPKASRTLMRHSVKKPKPSLKRHLTVQGYTEPLDQPSVIAVNTLDRHIDEKRLKHADKVPKSRLISRFSSNTTAPGQPAVTASVTAAPPASRQAALEVPSTVKPTAKHHKQAKTTADILELAISQADSYREPAPSKTHRSRAKKGVGIGAAVTLSVLALAVVIAQNLPNARLQMASAKAGFNASLPAYQPAGFSLGQLNYSNGIVATKFHSNSDERAYSITQKLSSWDSLALRDNFVAPSDSHYQTVNSGGQIIYLYGRHNATWVKGGVWYVIQANDSLTDQQLVKLASSL